MGMDDGKAQLLIEDSINRFRWSLPETTFLAGKYRQRRGSSRQRLKPGKPFHRQKTPLWTPRGCKLEAGRLRADFDRVPQVLVAPEWIAVQGQQPNWKVVGECAADHSHVVGICAVH